MIRLVDRLIRTPLSETCFIRDQTKYRRLHHGSSSGSGSGSCSSSSAAPKEIQFAPLESDTSG